MRLIDADALIETLKKYIHDYSGRNTLGQVANAITQDHIIIVNDRPTVEAVPVIRSKWHKLHETKLTKTVECIHCHCTFRYKKESDIVVDLFEFCPNCGAKMKGE